MAYLIAHSSMRWPDPTRLDDIDGLDEADDITPENNRREADMPPDARRAHVLIVEDDPDTREALADILAFEGYRTALAAHGREALEYLRSHAPPDLIVLDLMMPVMDGWAFSREQRQDPRLADIPVVVVSGAADTPHTRADIRAVEHLTKPLNLRALLDLIDRHSH